MDAQFLKTQEEKARQQLDPTFGHETKGGGGGGERNKWTPNETTQEEKARQQLDPNKFL